MGNADDAKEQDEFERQLAELHGMAVRCTGGPGVDPDVVRRDLDKILGALEGIPALCRYDDGARILWVYVNPVFMTDDKWLMLVLPNRNVDVVWNKHTGEDGITGWFPDKDNWGFGNAVKATDRSGDIPKPFLRSWPDIRGKLVGEARSHIGRMLHEKGLEW